MSKYDETGRDEKIGPGYRQRLGNKEFSRKCSFHCPSNSSDENMFYDEEIYGSRDSNFWSEVSSIGPSVSATGSIVEDELEGFGVKKVSVKVYAVFLRHSSA